MWYCLVLFAQINNLSIFCLFIFLPSCHCGSVKCRCACSEVVDLASKWELSWSARQASNEPADLSCDCSWTLSVGDTALLIWHLSESWAEAPGFKRTSWLELWMQLNTVSWWHCVVDLASKWELSWSARLQTNQLTWAVNAAEHCQLVILLSLKLLLLRTICFKSWLTYVLTDFTVPDPTQLNSAQSIESAQAL